MRRKTRRAKQAPSTDETMAKLAAVAALEPTKDGEEQSTGDVAGAFVNGQVPIDWYFDDQDPEAFRRNYPEMMHDAAVKAAMMALLFEVCALDLNVHPADTDDEEAQEVAEFVKYALCTGQGGLTALLMKMAKPALVNQFSVSELVYRTETRGRWAGKWVLSAVKSKDITNGNWSFRLDAFKNVLGIIHMQEGQTKVFDPAKFVRYACMPDYENPRACSHLRAAYRAWWVKRTVMRAWAVFAERQGLIPYGTYQSEPQKKQLEAQLAKFNARRWLAVPEGVKLAVIRYVSSESGKSQQDIIRDLDKQIFLAIRLAFLQALEGDRTGARSMGEVHETTADLMAWFLAADLASAINTQIVPRLVELNFGEDTPCPVVKLESPTEEDLVQRSQVDQALTNIGLELSKKQLREVYGRVEPEGDEDSLKKAEPPPSPFGGGGAPPFGGKPGEEPPDDEPKDGQPPKPEAKKEPDEDLAKLAADDQAWLARSYRRLLQVLEPVSLAFDPDQPRDADGQWSDSGVGGAGDSGAPAQRPVGKGSAQATKNLRAVKHAGLANHGKVLEAAAKLDDVMKDADASPKQIEEAKKYQDHLKKYMEEVAKTGAARKAINGWLKDPNTTAGNRAQAQRWSDLLAPHEKALGIQTALAYDPDQPRASDGEWTSGGGGSTGGASKPPASLDNLAGKEWTQPTKTAAELYGTDPGTPVKSYTVYHVTKRENAESILKNGFDLTRTKTRWQNDYAVSTGRGLKQSRAYFTRGGESFDDKKYVVLEVKVRGRVISAEKTSSPAASPQMYAKNVMRKGYDIADAGHFYIYNTKAIASIKALPPAAKLAYDPDQARDDGGRWTSGGGGAIGGDAARGKGAPGPTTEYQPIKTGAKVDGREVLAGVPNQASISSSLNEYEELPGIREVPMDAFDPQYKPKPYSIGESERLERLQAAIKESGQISPLIVVIDDKGPYILEGGHRFDALHRLGAKSFPAKVVVDTESAGEDPAKWKWAYRETEKKT